MWAAGTIEAMERRWEGGYRPYPSQMRVRSSSVRLFACVKERGQVWALSSSRALTSVTLVYAIPQAERRSVLPFAQRLSESLSLGGLASQLLRDSTELIVIDTSNGLDPLLRALPRTRLSLS